MLDTEQYLFFVICLYPQVISENKWIHKWKRLIGHVDTLKHTSNVGSTVTFAC